ncbi:MAG: S9 family peptidase [Bacteroidales bacterium]|nr:S9 family peptidase [Bacteroidales bacterium]
MKQIAVILIYVVFIPFLAISQEKALDLDLVIKSETFRTERLPGLKSMADGEHYLVLEEGSINIYAYKSGKRTGTLVEAENLVPEYDTIPIRISSYSLSKDESKLLIPTETERIYRRSSKSYYYIYSIPEKKLLPLSESGKQQHATFSPDGAHIAFVRDNNLFIYNIENNLEQQITNDGEFNKIIYGSADWVYEEEFGFSKAFFWSPDGENLAFYRFDETNVKEFTMMMWGELYPEPYTFKYPKAGESNSVIDIRVYNLRTHKTISMNIGTETDIYIPRVKWTADPNILSIQWMNRLQNELKILLAHATSGNTETIYHETNKYYIDITDNLTFFSDNSRFIFTSEQDGFNHIYIYDMLGNLEQQVTKGDWDVTHFIGIDEKNEWIYYVSAENSPLNRDIYKIRPDASEKIKLSEREGNNDADFSSNYKYFLNTWSEANTPPVIEVWNSKGKKLRTLTDNSDLKAKKIEYNFSGKEFFSFKTSEGTILNGWMIKPPDFDSTKSYPLLMYVYGGPGSQTVLNSWGNGSAWYQFLAQNGLVIASVDNRGTGARGELFKKMTYLQLGKYETIDQVEAARYLGNLSYIDKSRIGIWGWSYGGFMTASCLTLGAEVFSMGISVAPVTNWRYYDNIYTERFMRTPIENPEGYDQNSPINHVEKLKGDFLLIHGTADDNVHVQNSIDLTTALVNADKQFEMQFYPNSNHGIYTGRNTRYHLYTRMTDFISENLLKKQEY